MLNFSTDTVTDKSSSLADEPELNNNLDLDINTEDNNKSDEDLINELKRNISRNSHEIADLSMLNDDKKLFPWLKRYR